MARSEWRGKGYNRYFFFTYRYDVKFKICNLVNEYIYSAGGKKLSAIHKSFTEKRTDYVGNMVYKNSSLKRILVNSNYTENEI